MTSPHRLPPTAALWLAGLLALASCGTGTGDGTELDAIGTAADLTAAAEPVSSTEPSPTPTVAAPTATGSPPGEVGRDALGSALGPSDDVAATVAALAAFPPLATAPEAEITSVSISTADSGYGATDQVLVRYLTSFDPGGLPAFLDGAATGAGWTALPVDDGSYGGTESLLTAAYDRPDVDRGEGEEDVRIEVSPAPDGRSEVTILAIEPSTAPDPWARYAELLDAIPVPDGAPGPRRAEWTATIGIDGVTSTARLTIDYPDAMAEELLQQLANVVGPDAVVTPGGVGPGLVEVGDLGGFDVVVYETGLGADGASASLSITAERVTTG
ncbi:MAG: hypothetical protein AAFN30_00520 [Actinomycetota bacterium]